MSRRYAIDSLAVRDSRAFGWGWYLDDTAPARTVHLRLRLADGRPRELRCPQTGSRPDLVEAYPQVAHAGGGGFMLQARLSAGVVDATLRVQLADGRIDEIALPGFSEAYAAETASKSRLQRLWPLLRDGKWHALWRRFADWWLRRGAGASSRAAAVPSANGARWVVFDHAMGGGSNHFRNEKLAEWRAAGHDVVLVTPRLSTLEYDISGIDVRGEAWVQRHPDLTRCLAALGACAQVVVNDLPSFDDPLRVLDWALARQREGARILFYLHDFHAACPAWTLIGSDGHDCGLPAFAQCARCLPANSAPFLAMLPALDVPEWRRAWGEFLMAADEIVAFSASSIGILRRAYPMIDPARIELRPHSLAYLGAASPAFKPRMGETTIIAVVGAISEYKGARIVAEMAGLIEREGLPARIVVVGSIDGVPPSEALRVTGPYRVADLSAILEREGVGVALLPSVWHETFSYVTAELMHCRVPLAVFELGAPAERVRTYPLGHIISAIDARTALMESIAFHRSLLRA